MRVVCFHPAREPLMCGEGPVRVGCAPDDTIVLAGPGVEERHLTIVADARGLVLTVRPGCQRVYVNARAVRESALLHYGDTITLGASKLLVASNAAPPDAKQDARPDTVVGDVVLRIVSGAASGQALAVAPELQLGSGSRHFGDLSYGCRVARTADGLVFESGSNLPRVNGWRRDRVALAPNDQIALGEHRLIVEAPGLEYARHLASLPPPAPQPPEVREEDEPSSSSEIWWLIGAAVVLAAVIALFLYFRW
ncbi:MAG: FHA domain-containing protein [Rhodanobacteraceae bacterium]